LREGRWRRRGYTWIILHETVASSGSSWIHASRPVATERVVDDDAVVVEVLRVHASLIECEPVHVFRGGGEGREGWRRGGGGSKQ
jgi:hypothetical protein